MNKVFLIIMMVFSLAYGYGQKIIVLGAEVVNGDTIPQINLDEVEIFTLRIPRTYRGRRRLTRLVKNVKKVYPYAKLAGKKLREYDKLLQQAKNDRERKKLMKRAEKEINEEYGGQLKDLTFTQGKILLKLIDRETGETSYNLVQQLRGSFSAFFYQAFARIWGYNLKVRYDPQGRDKTIETIVKMIELGQI